MISRKKAVTAQVTEELVWVRAGQHAAELATPESLVVAGLPLLTANDAEFLRQAKDLVANYCAIPNREIFSRLSEMSKLTHQ